MACIRRGKATLMAIASMLTLSATHVSAAVSAETDPGAVQVLPVAKNVYLLVGAGGNAAVAVGRDQVLLVDTQSGPAGEQLYAAIRTITDKPVRTVVNTHAHPDHVGGNAYFVGKGATLFARDSAAKRMQAGWPNDLTPDPADRVAPVIQQGLPRRTYRQSLDLSFAGEQVEILSAGSAHTDGDSFVFFRTSNVLHMGDVFITEGFPVIDRSAGGTVTGTIAALNRAIELAGTAPGFLSGRGNTRGGFPPPPGHEGRTDTILISGHGRLYDQADLLQYRDMVVIIRDRIADLVGKGMSLEQVKAARPTLGWDTRYGSDTPPFTTERFVENVFHEIQGR